MINTLSEEELAKSLVPYIPRMYVYYDDFNNVTAISNITNLGGNYIEVPQYRIDDFINRGKDFNKFKIDYFRSDAPVKEEKDHIMHHLLYMVPVLKTKVEKDLVLLFNKNKKTWKFSLSPSGVEKINLENKDKIFNFYVTQHKNPHYLISTIAISGNELIQGKEVKFDGEYECDLTKFSIFTSPNFDSYGIIENDTQI